MMKGMNLEDQQTVPEIHGMVLSGENVEAWEIFQTQTFVSWYSGDYLDTWITPVIQSLNVSHFINDHATT